MIGLPYSGGWFPHEDVNKLDLMNYFLLKGRKKRRKKREDWEDGGRSERDWGRVRNECY